MEFKFSDEQEQFRDEVVAFIDDNWDAPPASLEPDNQEAFEAGRSYERKLAENG